MSYGERMPEVRIVSVTKDELDGLRRHAAEMQAILRDLRDGYAEICLQPHRAAGELGLRAARSIAEQETKGLIRIPTPERESNA